jgi:hypothetical protein
MRRSAQAKLFFLVADADVHAVKFMALTVKGNDRRILSEQKS